MFAYGFSQYALWYIREGSYKQNLTSEERAAFDMKIRAGYGRIPGCLWYERTKATLNPDAVRYIDDVLAQPERFPARPEGSTPSPTTVNLPSQ